VPQIGVGVAQREDRLIERRAHVRPAGGADRVDLLEQRLLVVGHFDQRRDPMRAVFEGDDAHLIARGEPLDGDPRRLLRQRDALALH